MTNIFFASERFCQLTFEELKQYIENGGDINIKNKYGDTALIKALMEHGVGAFKFLCVCLAMSSCKVQYLC